MNTKELERLIGDLNSIAKGTLAGPDVIAERCRVAAELLSDQLPKNCGIPIAEIVAVYHDRLPMLPAVRAVNAARRAAIRSRWIEFKHRQNLEFWDSMFKRAAESEFLTGGNNSGWRAGFDFFLQPSSLLKLEEGFYNRDQRRQTPEGSRDSYLDSVVGEHAARTQRIAGIAR